jgi:transcriptional regulator with XRE-family HTH domain
VSTPGKERGVPILIARTWMDLARERLRERRIHDSELARRIGVSRNTVYNFFTLGRTTRQIAERIATELDLPPPVVNSPDAARWVAAGAALAQMAPADYRELLESIEEWVAAGGKLARGKEKSLGLVKRRLSD